MNLLSNQISLKSSTKSDILSKKRFVLIETCKKLDFYKNLFFLSPFIALM